MDNERKELLKFSIAIICLIMFIIGSVLLMTSIGMDKYQPVSKDGTIVKENPKRKKLITTGIILTCVSVGLYAISYFGL